MEYAIGVLLGVVVAGLGKWVGFDRDRAFYPTVLIVIASYYPLFAVIGAPARTLVMEIALAMVFLVVAVVGFKKHAWILAAGIAGHGAMDFVHHLLIQNPGLPEYWPGFCAAIDLFLGGWLAVSLKLTRTETTPTAKAPLEGGSHGQERSANGLEVLPAGPVRQ